MRVNCKIQIETDDDINLTGVWENMLRNAFAQFLNDGSMVLINHESIADAGKVLSASSFVDTDVKQEQK